MLNSFYISNYRILRDFTIPKLARVNLITGKNNTGKTTLLEAILLHQNGFNPNLIAQILTKRDVLYKIGIDEIEESLKYLRYDNLAEFKSKIQFESGEINKLFKYTVSVTRIETEKEILIEKKLDNNSSLKKERFKEENLTKIFPVIWNKSILIDSYDFRNNENFNFLYDQIDGKKLEDELINALSIITPIEKFRFVKGESEIKRIPTVLKAGDTDRTPMRMMGDGMNRLLNIILAMLNCKDGIFLVDEIENGLHYSVMEKMWEVIFHLSEKLNIQVFATTHSNDVVKSFGTLLLNDSNKESGQMIKLKNNGTKIVVVDFNLENIEVSLSHDIELR